MFRDVGCPYYLAIERETSCHTSCLASYLEAIGTQSQPDQTTAASVSAASPLTIPSIQINSMEDDICPTTAGAENKSLQSLSTTHRISYLQAAQHSNDAQPSPSIRRITSVSSSNENIRTDSLTYQRKLEPNTPPVESTSSVPYRHSWQSSLAIAVQYQPQND